MSSTTVAEFANELKKSTDTLLEQLKSAGVAKSTASDKLTEADKQHLLSYLQASHGTASAERKKITLVKKSTSEIKQADSTGKARTIQVEVRKKRTFVRREDGVEVAVEAPEAEHEIESAPLIDNAELARREEEARRPWRRPGAQHHGPVQAVRRQLHVGAGARAARSRGHPH